MFARLVIGNGVCCAISSELVVHATDKGGNYNGLVSLRRWSCWRMMIFRDLILGIRLAMIQAAMARILHDQNQYYQKDGFD